MLPQVFTLHMVHYTAFILLLKPFILTGGKATTQRSNIPSDGNDPAGKAPLVVCYEATRQLCVVARKYRQMFGSFRNSPITATHCTLSAALFLLKKMKHDSDRIKVSDRNLFRSCLKTLEELGTSWYPAWRYWNNLSRAFAALCDTVGDSGISDYPTNYTASPDSQVADGGLHADDQKDPELAHNSTWSDTMDWAINLPEDLHFSASDEQELPDSFGITSDASLWSDVGAEFVFDSLPADYTNFNTLN